MKTKSSFILIAAMLLAACGAKAGPTPAGTMPAAQSGEVNVSIVNFAFDPGSLTITTGTTVTWTNNDTVAHDVLADDGTWGSVSLAKGDTYTYTFTKTGIYSYHCGVHPTMKATITVVAP